MKKVKITVMISGGGTNLQSLIYNIHNNKDINGEIVSVISNKEDVYGLSRAQNHNIKTKVINRNQYASELEYEKSLFDFLEGLDTDLIVLAGYLSFIPITIIKKYENKIINIHPSLVPSFCGKGFYGKKVHKAVIERGVKITGATVHFVNEEMDGGPIIIQRAVNVDLNDTIESLSEKVLKVEHEILPLAVKLFIDDKLKVINNKVDILNV